MCVFYYAPGADDMSIWYLWLSMHYLPAATVADELGIVDALCEEPMTLDALAEKLSLNARALAVTLSVLCALNLAARRDGAYHPTMTARTYLRSGGDYYWGPLFSSYKDASPIHAQLLSLLKTGDAGVAGRNVEGWAAGKIAPDTARFIAKFMHAHSLPAAVAVVNPNRLDQETPHRALAAVGVSFLLAVAVNRALRAAGWWRSRRRVPAPSAT